MGCVVVVGAFVVVVGAFVVDGFAVVVALVVVVVVVVGIVVVVVGSVVVLVVVAPVVACCLAQLQGSCMILTAWAGACVGHDSVGFATLVIHILHE